MPGDACDRTGKNGTPPFALLSAHFHAYLRQTRAQNPGRYGSRRALLATTMDATSATAANASHIPASHQRPAAAQTLLITRKARKVA